LPEAFEITMPLNEIENNTDLLQAGMDSIGFVNLVIEIEDKFSITFPQDKFVAMLAGTINKLAEIIENAVGGDENVI
jgi:acyl carrier protein